MTMLRAKLLAALSNTCNEIVYDAGLHHQTRAMRRTVACTEFWYYPWQPAAGQQVRTRSLTYSTDGKLHKDVGDQLRDARAFVEELRPSRLRAWPMGERISVDYVAKTWSDVKDTPVMLIEPPGEPAR